MAHKNYIVVADNYCFRPTMIMYHINRRYETRIVPKEKLYTVSFYRFHLERISRSRVGHRTMRLSFTERTVGGQFTNPAKTRD